MKLKRIIKLLIFLIIFLSLFYLINKLFLLKSSFKRSNNFFKQKEEFDVLFFGTSHVMNGIYPMELWNNYGIISYNLGKPGETLATTYHNINMALKYHNPKVICVDTSMFFNEKVNSNRAFAHYSMDSYPISYEKCLAIKDLFGEKDLLDNEIEYLLKFPLYHSRWNELKEEDFTEIKECEKGAGLVTKVATSIEKSNSNIEELYSEKDNINIEYLIKIIKFCNEKNIELFITYLPQTKNEKCILNAEYIGNICKENNVNYINFFDIDIVDDIDFYNMIENNAHLNSSGARKVTDYLGKYITENYNIVDHRKDEIYSFWNEDYNKYIDFKIKKIEENKNELNNCLSLLYNEKDIEYKITISSKLQIEEGNLLEKLLRNLNNNYITDDEVFRNKKEKNINIILYDARNQNKIMELWF